jgi:hypothetical protein
MREITPEIFRLYVDGKYVDYYGSLKRAEITARMYRNQGKTVKILEDMLDGTGSLKEVNYQLD